MRETAPGRPTRRSRLRRPGRRSRARRATSAPDVAPLPLPSRPPHGDRSRGADYSGLGVGVERVFAGLSEPNGLSAADRISAVERALRPVFLDHPSPAEQFAPRRNGFPLPVENAPRCHAGDHVITVVLPPLYLTHPIGASRRDIPPRSLDLVSLLGAQGFGIFAETPCTIRLTQA